MSFTGEIPQRRYGPVSARTPDPATCHAANSPAALQGVREVVGIVVLTEPAEAESRN